MNKIALILGVAALVGLVVTPSAAAQEPTCMPVYNEYDVGPYTIVQRSSCQYEIHENEDWDPPLDP